MFKISRHKNNVAVGVSMRTGDLEPRTWRNLTICMGALLGIAIGISLVPIGELFVAWDLVGLENIDDKELSIWLLVLLLGMFVGSICGGVFYAIHNKAARIALIATALALFFVAPISRKFFPEYFASRLNTYYALYESRNASALLRKIEDLPPSYRREDAIAFYSELEPEKALKHKESDFRYLSAIHLGNKEDRRSIPVLCQALKENWKRTYIDDLYFGYPIDYYHDYYILVMETLAHLDQGLALPFLTHFLHEESDSFRREQAVDILANVPSSKTTALLVQMLEHPSAEIREAAGLALVKRGDARGLEEVVPAVRKGLLDDSVIKGLVKINNLRAHELLVLCVKSLSYGTSNQVAVDSLRIWEHRWGKRLKK